MECMCAQTRLFTLSFERGGVFFVVFFFVCLFFWGMESEPMLTPKGKIPSARGSEED